MYNCFASTFPVVTYTGDLNKISLFFFFVTETIIMKTPDRSLINLCELVICELGNDSKQK